ncbi:MAG: VWA domain-containing protein [Pseudomonadota bacterium]
MHKNRARMIIGILGSAFSSWAVAQVTLTAPERVGIGSAVPVEIAGETARADFLTIVAEGTPEGSYERYEYARAARVELKAPHAPGTYEIRYLGAARPYPTLARATLLIEAVEASLEAPAAIAAGSPIELHWRGPANPLDFLTIVAADAAEGSSEAYVYTKKGSPLTLNAPDQPGTYEIRYALGDVPYTTIGRHTIEVTGTNATLDFPSPVMAGAPVSITWAGPGNELDYLTIVAPDTPEGTWDEYVYTKVGNPVTLGAPETPGAYEVRYLTGQSDATLAAASLIVTPATAALDAPDSAAARTIIEVRWQGPGNDRDYVAIHRPEEDNQVTAPYGMVRRGPVLRIETPAEAGAYELRYITGRERRTLATRTLVVSPREVPGRLRVVAGNAAAAPDTENVVAVILDASGSMLQRLDGTRRIELARRSVATLIGEGLPDDTAFGLWVFGHREPDTCRTDLEIPIGPIDRAAAIATVNGVDAKNLARTPIAASLSEVGADLAGRAGEHLVILVTDGEETCDGDPATVIENLRAGGLDVRVNIVGFAIDELMLRETFVAWARLGGGRYFDAADSDALTRSLVQAVDPTYEVLDAAGKVVAAGTVNGDALSLPPGTYRVREAGGAASDAVTVVADEEAVVTRR